MRVLRHIDFRVTLKPDYTATITVNPASLISETSRVFVEQQFWQPLGDSNPCQRAENPASWTSRRRGRLMGNWLGNVDSNHDYLIQSQASCLLDDSPPIFRGPLTGRRRNHTSLFLIAQGGQEHFVTPPRSSSSHFGREKRFPGTLRAPGAMEHAFCVRKNASLPGVRCPIKGKRTTRKSGRRSPLSQDLRITRCSR